jgi:hypothetical protein
VEWEVIGLSHDGGAGVLSLAVVWQHERFGKSAFLPVGYSTLRVFVDMNGLNAYGHANLIYTQLGCFYFLNSLGAAGLVSSNIAPLSARRCEMLSVFRRLLA